MSNGKSKGGRYLGRGILLPIIVLVMVAAASIAAVKIVLYPSNGAPSTAVSAEVSSSAPSGESSSAPASSLSPPASSSNAKAGSYDDFASAVFIGDSLTSGISGYSIIDNAGVYADNGMSTSSVLTKKVSVGGKSMLVTDALKQAKPKMVYILLGSNDVNWMSQKTFIANYGKVIDRLKAAAPAAVYYVQSIFPVTAAFEKTSGVTNGKIDAYNAALAQFCNEKGIKYVDVGEVLKGNDGKLLPAAASDGYNIKKAYYRTWLDYLTTHE